MSQAGRDVSYAYERILPVLWSSRDFDSRLPLLRSLPEEKVPLHADAQVAEMQTVNNSQGKIYRKLLGWHRAPRGDHRPR